jgi:hypothetical protein
VNDELERALNPRARRVLWLDSAPAIVVGVGVLALDGLLAELYGFDASLVRFIGAANLGYGCYSGALAARATRGKAPARRAIELLVLLNLAWAVVCALLLFRYARDASALGIAQLVLEGLYVTSLALAEWRIVRPHSA